MGNHHPSYAPHGCYPRQGEDNWVTIAVASDQEWGASCDAMGRPELAKDEFDAALHLNLYDGLRYSYLCSSALPALTDRARAFVERPKSGG